MGNKEPPITDNQQCPQKLERSQAEVRGQELEIEYSMCDKDLAIQSVT